MVVYIKGKMKKKSIAGLIVISAIVAVVMFSGCIGSKTPIHDIRENPDKYVDKKVTIKATVEPGNKEVLIKTWSGSYLRPAIKSKLGRRSPDCSGFWIGDIEPFSSEAFYLHDDIFVAYDGTIPGEQREDFEDKWGQRIGSRTVKVKGVVRHELHGQDPCFYIEGESWKFID